MSKPVSTSERFMQSMCWMSQLPPAEHMAKLLCFSRYISCAVVNTSSCDVECDSKQFPGVSVRTLAWGLAQQAFGAFACLDTEFSLWCPECGEPGHGESHELYGGVIAHPLVTMAARILKQANTVVTEDYDDEAWPRDMVIRPGLMLAVLRDPDCAPFLSTCERPGIIEALRVLEDELVEAVASRDCA